MALPIAIPAALPAVGQGILYGAGALGTGLAALGIIENKDAIRDGLSDFDDYVSNGIKNIGTMFQTGGGLNPSIDLKTGRYIAVPDATRVETTYPIKLLPKVRQTAKTPASTARTKKTRANTPTSTARTETSTPTPSPQNNNDNDSTKQSLVRRSIRLIKKNPKTSLAIGALTFHPTREYIVKPISNYVVPMVGNAVSYITAGETPFNIPAVAKDSTNLWYNGGIGIVKDSVLTKLGHLSNYLLTDSTIQTKKPVSVDTIKAISRDSVPITPIDKLIWSKEQ